MQRIVAGAAYPLHDAQATRALERYGAHGLPPQTLMQRAGLAVARLALALTPHARRIWIACGPGNNGGDGLEAAIHLHRWGKPVQVTWLGRPESAPLDAQRAYQRLLQAGLTPTEPTSGPVDLCIDALLGIGSRLCEPQGPLASAIGQVNRCAGAVLAVDLPSGLCGDTGRCCHHHVRATHTLSLLTLKPGLFTANGRDAAGSIWLDTLMPPAALDGVAAPTARLNPAPQDALRRHADHKGCFGDVAVLGGAAGMHGAALLAARAALHAGAGRVFVGLLDASAPLHDPAQPELMFRPPQALDLARLTVVCGCGGGAGMAAWLPGVLASAAALVLDADALNALAADAALQQALAERAGRQAETVLTPHPLEAARLLGGSTADIQSDRLASARALAERWRCTVVLKGSGTVVCAPGRLPAINPTGNGRLATAGSGDVLAGLIGARLAQGESGFDAACHAVYPHGHLADVWPPGQPMTAGMLSKMYCSSIANQGL